MYKVYISGKITGLPIEQAKANFKKAEQELQALGFQTVNPFDNGVDESESWHVHMDVDLELLSKCSAIYQQDNWVSSEGARIEQRVALELGLHFIGIEKDTANNKPDPKQKAIADSEQLVYNINALRDLCHKQALNAGWNIDPTTGKEKVRNKGEMMMLIVSEVAEAMEADRKQLKDDHLPHRDGIEVELADALIRIVQFCGEFNLDIGGATVEKLAYNAQRADHKLENRATQNGKKY